MSALEWKRALCRLCIHAPPDYKMPHGPVLGVDGYRERQLHHLPHPTPAPPSSSTQAKGWGGGGEGKGRAVFEELCFLCLSLSLSLCLALSVCLCVFVSVCVFVYLCLSLSVCLSVSFCLCLSLSLSLSVSACLSLSDTSFFVFLRGVGRRFNMMKQPPPLLPHSPFLSHISTIRKWKKRFMEDHEFLT